jgi:hypothetical protein
MKTLLIVAPLLFAQPDSAKAYLGPDGERVEVVVLAPRKDARAYVRISGAQWDFNGLALPCTVRTTRNLTEYIARRSGADWTLLRIEEGTGTLHLPLGRTVNVALDDVATGSVVPDKVIAASDPKRVAAFSRKEWPYLEKKYDAQAQTAAAKLNGACGRPVSLVLDWYSFDDEAMGEHDIWRACEPIAARLSRSCALAQGLSEVHCRGGSTYGLAREDAALVFTTVPGDTRGAAFLEAQK